MKRRTFLTAAGTIGIVGAASSTTVVSSVYNDISSNLLLGEFDNASKARFDKFIFDINENANALGIDTHLVRKFAMPVKIIKNDNIKGTQNLEYKSKSGQIISISTEKGISTLKVLNS